MLGRVERRHRQGAGRWGEGAEHLHWWFIGRPEGMGQLRSSFAEIWDEVLPPTPREVWRTTSRGSCGRCALPSHFPRINGVDEGRE